MGVGVARVVHACASARGWRGALPGLEQSGRAEDQNLGILAAEAEAVEEAVYPVDKEHGLPLPHSPRSAWVTPGASACASACALGAQWPSKA